MRRKKFEVCTANVESSNLFSFYSENKIKIDSMELRSFESREMA